MTGEERRTPTLWLSLHRLFHLSFSPARDTGRAEHYNSTSLSSASSRCPLLLRCNLSFLSFFFFFFFFFFVVVFFFFFFFFFLLLRYLLPLPYSSLPPFLFVRFAVLPPRARCRSPSSSASLRRHWWRALSAAQARREMQGHAAPLLASKTVLDPRATLHTIRERHDTRVASLWPTLPLVQHVVTTDVTRHRRRPRLPRRHENLRARTHSARSSSSVLDS